MRTIDDLIDNYKAANRSIMPSERKEFVADVNEWLKMVIITDDCNPDKVELIKQLRDSGSLFGPLKILQSR